MKIGKNSIYLHIICK